MNPRWPLALSTASILLVCVSCVFGGFIAPNSHLTQNREQPWRPPTPIHFVDTDGALHLRPFVYPPSALPSSIPSYSDDTRPVLPIKFLVRGDSYRLAGLISTDLHLVGLEPPHRLYLLGTDGTGRDVLARTLQGGATSLLTGLLAAIIALAVGSSLGLIAGQLGGKLDSTLMRGTELFLALPWLYLLLGVRAFLPLELTPAQASIVISLLLGLLGWPPSARLIRGFVIAAKQQSYVEAARLGGLSEIGIILKHILPQTVPLVRTQATILIPTFVLAEVTLSYLGIGISEPHPSWGTLLASLQQFYVVVTYWWMFAPLPLMLITFVSLHTLAGSKSSIFQPPTQSASQST